jgi:protein SCO1
MISKKKNYTYIIGIAVALGLPLFCYIVVSTLSKNVIHPPRYYVMDSVAVTTKNGKKQEDTVFHRVADLRLTNQLGAQISTDSSLKGKILVFDFFFVSCPTICPRLTANLKLLQQAFKKNPKTEFSYDTIVQILSITVNPVADSFQRLRTYADRYGANPDKWWFLTGDKKVIYNFARNELFVTVVAGDGGPDDFIHTEKLVLVDKNRFIRGYYNGLDSADLRRCADDIVLLTLEKGKK